MPTSKKFTPRKIELKKQKCNRGVCVKLNILCGQVALSAMENIPDTPEGIILESLLEGMNQYYSAELAQKVRRGMNESRIKGNYQGGGLPYRYKVIGKKIHIDEETAPVVNYIYEQYSIGVYLRDIISTLTRKGIYHKGKRKAVCYEYRLRHTCK